MRSPLLGTTVSEDRSARETKKTAGSLKDISKKAAQAAERDAIVKALEATHWNRLSAAKLLEISYRSLFYKMKDVGLNGKPGGSDHP